MDTSGRYWGDKYFFSFFFRVYIKFSSWHILGVAGSLHGTATTTEPGDWRWVNARQGKGSACHKSEHFTEGPEQKWWNECRLFGCCTNNFTTDCWPLKYFIERRTKSVLEILMKIYNLLTLEHSFHLPSSSCASFPSFFFGEFVVRYNSFTVSERVCVHIYIFFIAIRLKQIHSHFFFYIFALREKWSCHNFSERIDFNALYAWCCNEGSKGNFHIFSLSFHVINLYRITVCGSDVSIKTWMRKNEIEKFSILYCHRCPDGGRREKVSLNFCCVKRHTQHSII